MAMLLNKIKGKREKVLVYNHTNGTSNIHLFNIQPNHANPRHN
jgi:hypothetical protein